MYVTSNFNMCHLIPTENVETGINCHESEQTMFSTVPQQVNTPLAAKTETTVKKETLPILKQHTHTYISLPLL